MTQAVMSGPRRSLGQRMWRGRWGYAFIALPAVLFADLDDPERARFLERTLAPLTIGSSQLGIREIGALMRAALAGR